MVHTWSEVPRDGARHPAFSAHQRAFPRSASPQSTRWPAIPVSFAGQALQGAVIPAQAPPNAVIPAQAGIHTFLAHSLQRTCARDSRLPGNDCARGIQNDTNTQPARKPENSNSHERTRQPIENKGPEVSYPVNPLKVILLALLSRQGTENKDVSPEKPAIKNSNPVNLLKLNRVSSTYPVKSLKLKALT